MEHKWILYLLPLGGLAINAMYRAAKQPLTTNTVLDSVRSKKPASPFLAPFIFIGASVTHLFGGSAGREGAALQIGGGIGSQIGRMLRLNSPNMSIAVVCGMAAAFSAIFTTPVAAVIFALEVVTVGHFKYFQLAPAMIASACAYIITILMGNEVLYFNTVPFPHITVFLMFKIVVFASLIALLSIIYCYSLKYAERAMDKVFKNGFVKIAAGGIIIVIFTLIAGDQTYNGTGMNIVTGVLSGDKVEWFSFAVKILFTAITVAAGYKGGEIVPAMFVGATFGCAAAAVFGFDTSFAAAIALICIFCGITNCPIASFVMGVELFGSQGALIMGIAVAVSYVLSGTGGLYTSQRLVYSKTDIEKVDIFTK